MAGHAQNQPVALARSRESRVVATVRHHFHQQRENDPQPNPNRPTKSIMVPVAIKKRRASRSRVTLGLLAHGATTP